ncbi:MAG TPA: FHA domain-containing protein, partial [Cellvibrio sp.]
NDGDLVQFASGHWQFVRAQIYGPTEVKSARHINDFEFVFNMSLDEETTQLELHQQQVLDLAVRTHHYLLLQLARHRCEDAARGLDSKSQGWVYAEQLAAELGLDSTHMNIQIFRARKQLADVLPDALGQQCLLERRGGKIRFGCEKFKIYKGDQLTAASTLKDC